MADLDEESDKELILRIAAEIPEDLDLKNVEKFNQVIESTGLLPVEYSIGWDL